MLNQETLYNVADRVATITLNRPDKLNAWTATMEQEVRAAMHEAEHDQNVRVIVLTGAGRGFCAGADMSLLGAIAQQGLGDRGQEQGRPPTNSIGSSRPRLPSCYSAWLVAGVVPGLDRGPLKKVGQYHCLSQLAVDHGPRWW